MSILTNKLNCFYKQILTNYTPIVKLLQWSVNMKKDYFKTFISTKQTGNSMPA